LNVPSTVDLYKKESSSTPQMFIFPLANWVTQSLSCPLSSVSSSFFACGAGSNFSICDQLMLNCKHFPKSQRSVQVLSWKNLWKERKFEAKRFIIVLFFLALHDRDARKAHKSELFLNGCELGEIKRKFMRIFWPRKQIFCSRDISINFKERYFHPTFPCYSSPPQCL
jgi:hypothetical protein